MRLFLASLFVLGFASTARADVILKNTDSVAHGLRIVHVVGSVTTEIPRHATMIISGSEQARSIQLQDSRGRPVGNVVPLEDGDRLTIRHGAIIQVHAPPDAQ